MNKKFIVLFLTLFSLVAGKTAFGMEEEKKRTSNTMRITDEETGDCLTINNLELNKQRGKEYNNMTKEEKREFEKILRELDKPYIQEIISRFNFMKVIEHLKENFKYKKDMFCTLKTLKKYDNTEDFKITINILMILIIGISEYDSIINTKILEENVHKYTIEFVDSLKINCNNKGPWIVIENVRDKGCKLFLVTCKKCFDNKAEELKKFYKQHCGEYNNFYKAIEYAETRNKIRLTVGTPPKTSPKNTHETTTDDNSIDYNLSEIFDVEDEKPRFSRRAAPPVSIPTTNNSMYCFRNKQPDNK
jgi:hypothetical protein